MKRQPTLPPPPHPTPPPGPASRVSVGALVPTLVYAVFAGLWVLLSDLTVIWHYKDPFQLALANTLKGWLFVAVTSLLLYLLLRRRAQA